MEPDDFVERYAPDPDFTPLEAAIDARLARDYWWQSEQRRTIVRRTVERTLADDTGRPVPERRRAAQREVRSALDIDLETVEQRCHEDLFQGYEYVPDEAYHRAFDQVIADIERERI